MGNVRPPDAPAGPPRTLPLPAGTSVFRLHVDPAHATTFNPILSHRYYDGGRFDATEDDPYAYSYVASTAEVAVAEYLLRDLAVDHAGPRLLSQARVDGRHASRLTTTAPLALLDLTDGQGLAAVSQDPWLTTAPPAAYAQTRHWGHWIRTHVPAVDGFAWRSYREPGGLAYVLFGDRAPAGLIVPEAHPAWGGASMVPLDTGDGAAWLLATLAAYHVTVDPGPP